jgi:hypothetical protein
MMLRDGATYYELSRTTKNFAGKIGMAVPSRCAEKADG